MGQIRKDFEQKGDYQSRFDNEVQTLEEMIESEVQKLKEQMDFEEKPD